MNTFTVARSALRASLARPSMAMAQQRGIAISAVRMSSGSHMVDPEKAAQELEKGKHQSVNGDKDNTVGHAPGWNEKIASESEAIVKGIKESKNPQELVKETVEKLAQEAEEEKKHSS